MHAHVRVAGDGDVDSLLALRRAWAEENDGPVDDDGFDARFTAWVAEESPSRTFFLAEVDGKAVGMANDHAPTCFKYRK